MQAQPVTNVVSEQRDCKIFVGLAIALFICIASSTFLRMSFWLDECITAWVISGNAEKVISRAREFQGQSPLYYLLAFFWQKIFSFGEFELRLLSVVLLSVITIVLFRWMRTVLSLSAAFIAVFALWSLDSIQLAMSARPYALAILFVTLALRAMYSFVSESDKKYSTLAIYSICATLAVYAHYFAILTILSASGAVCYLCRGSRSLCIKILLANCVSLLACLPNLSQVLLLSAKSKEITPPTQMSASQLIEGFFPLFTTLAFVVAFVAIAVMAREPIQDLFNFSPDSRDDRRKKLYFLAVTCWILPAVVLTLGSLLSGANLLLSRYLSFSIPAFAIALACLYHALKPKHRLRCALILVALLAIREINRSWREENWRGAVAAVGNSSDVLLASGLAESNHLSWLNSDSSETNQYLSAPFQVYGRTGHIELIPSSFANAALVDITRSKLLAMGAHSKPLNIVYFRSDALNSFGSKLEELLTSLGLSFDYQQKGLVNSLVIKKSKPQEKPELHHYHEYPPKTHPD